MQFLSRLRRKNIAYLVDDYMEYCRNYYAGPDGITTGGVFKPQSAMKRLVTKFGRLPIRKFTPLKMREFQQHCVKADLARSTINAYCREVRAFFKWAASEQRIPLEIYQAACTVNNLQRGRSGAREPEPIKPVSLQDVFRLRSFIRPVYFKLCRLQLLTAARPSELLNVRPRDIDRSGEVWTLKLNEHKSAYKGKERLIAFGPQAQDILREMMKGLPRNRYIFSIKGGRAPLSLDTWRVAIHRACAEAGVPRWCPNQLRHRAATELRKEFGLEGAQVALGHSDIGTTQIYAEVDHSLAIKIARKRG